MSNMKNQYFVNRYQFWKFLEPQCQGLNLNATLRLPLGYVCLDSGKDFNNASMYELIECVNEQFNLNYDKKHTTRIGQGLTLFWEEDGENQKSEGIMEESVEDNSLVSLEAQESVSEEELVDEEYVGEGIKEEAPTDTPEDDSKEVDWKWVESLSNTKSDKLALDEYAQGFGVSLSRVKKLENMVIDFKQAL